MSRRVFHTALPFPPEAVRAWHERPGAFQRLGPPHDPVEVIEQVGTVREGDRLVMRIPPGLRWEAVHHSLPDGFVDEMASGPFSSWRHAHRFVSDGQGGTVIHDEIDFTPAVTALAVDSKLRAMFAFRKQRLLADLGRHQGKTPMRVLLVGASGLVGSQLMAFLQTGGHEVVQLVRRAPGAGQIQWDPARGLLDPAAVEGFDAVVALNGENVGEGAWTDERKKALLDSRLGPTSLLARTLAQLSQKPKVWVNASAVGIYGNRGDEPLTEAAAPGAGFLAEVCKQWEAAAVEVPGVRVVKARLGVVLSARGGALAKMLTPFRLGGGGPIGGGAQYFPWVAMDDALYALHHLLYDESMSGPVNIVAPKAVTQASFASALGSAVNRPALVPLPAFAVRALFGQMGVEVLLGGQNVVPAKLSRGFTPTLPTLAEALRFELGDYPPAEPVEAS